MARNRLVVATRKSALALAQCRAWIATFRTFYPQISVEELHVTTSGDRFAETPLQDLGGKGLFIKEIEEAILDGRADLAVHSLKDVPAELAPGLAIRCIPEREDPRDVVVTQSGAALSKLPAASRVGTTSLRRSVQLSARYPALKLVPIRGNVDTRLRKCEEGDVDAVVLARAGLVRLGLAARATEVLDPTHMLPAVGQGALAIEQRAADSELEALLASLHHSETGLAVTAERGVLKAVEGDCRMPVAAYGVRADGSFWLRGFLAEPDGSRTRYREHRSAFPRSASEAEALGVELGLSLRQG